MPSSGGSGGKEDEETAERSKRKTMMGMGMGTGMEGAITPAAVVSSPLPRRPTTRTVGEERQLAGGLE